MTTENHGAGDGADGESGPGGPEGRVSGTAAPNAETDDRSGSRPDLRSALGWGLVLVVLGYAYWVHQGFGPPPGGMVRADMAWYEPRAFLLERSPFDGFIDRPVAGIALMSLVALAGALGVFWATRSAVARWLAMSAVVAVALFCFYGLVADRVWGFFKWRGSLVMVLTALAVGAAATAPALASSWKRRGWPLRLALYLPVFFLVLAFERNPTGTDESLPFNFSPWPAVPIFGLDMGAYLIVGVWLGVAAGLALLARAQQRGSFLALGVVATVGVATGFGALRFGGAPASVWIATALVAAVALALASLAPREEHRDRLLARATVFGLGALLAGLPLVAGRALADRDFAYTRHVRARTVIDALAVYYEREEEYPETLDELVEAGDLESLPRPRVGFDSLRTLMGDEPLQFSYQNLGSSYVLEFDAPEWVQCAYNPPWEDDWEDEEFGDEQLEPWETPLEPGEADDGADDGSEEAWSCPDTRPELW